MLYYDYRTGFIENNNEAYLTHAEALRNKWKCDKCSEKFQNYRLVHEHKTQFHSYQMQRLEAEEGHSRSLYNQNYESLFS